MTTNELLDKMGTAAFGTFFTNEIRAIFTRDSEAGKYGTEAKEYNASIRALRKDLSDQKLSLLSEYEELCCKIQDYSAQYGFIAGVYCGFKQILTFDREYDGGFDKYVVEEIALEPNMQRHTENYANIEKRNEVHGKITDGESKKIQKAMVVVECYWSQVAHSASLDGFYCGYRAAGYITDRVALTETSYMQRVSKQVTMEHALGYIESYSETERRLMRENAQKENQTVSESPTTGK